MQLKKKNLKSLFSHELYTLYIRTLIGKLIKKGNKLNALKLYKQIKENIKLQTEKNNEISFIIYIAMLNSLSKISFKEIRMGSQKNQIPIPILQKKQILISVATLLKLSKNNKHLQIEKLIEILILAYQNKGILIKNKRINYKKAILNKMLLSFGRNRRIKINIAKYVSKKNHFKIYKNKTPL